MDHAKQLFAILHSEDPVFAEKKLQLSIYIKSFYRAVYNEAMKRMTKEDKLEHIRLLFESISAPTLSLKAKFSLTAALDKMLNLYLLVEVDQQQLMTSINAMVNKILELAEAGKQQNNIDLLKSSFMLTEVMFTMNRADIHLSLLDGCVYKV